MSRKSTLAGIALLIGMFVPFAASASRPCGRAPCAKALGEQVALLQYEYDAPELSVAELSKMESFENAHTSGGQTDWKAVAEEYFHWADAQGLARKGKKRKLYKATPPSAPAPQLRIPTIARMYSDLMPRSVPI